MDEVQDRNKKILVHVISLQDILLTCKKVNVKKDIYISANYMQAIVVLVVWPLPIEMSSGCRTPRK